MSARAKATVKLPPEVNRIVYVRNLPFKITAAEMYDLFGKFGPIRQIRIGTAADTKGTALVVFEDIFDAKNCVDHLSGFNVAGRYLVCLYYQQSRLAAATAHAKSLDKKRTEVAQLRERLAATKSDSSSSSSTVPAPIAGPD